MARNLLYDRGVFKVERAAIPVISLGNLTTGGTGKTPLAAFVARWFRDRGVRVCFLSRGYGSKPGAVNDEALVLELLCPDVPHLQGADRVQSATIAREELESQLLILDDGFQHRRLARDIDLVLIDALNPWGHGHLLPRGLLREPLRAIRRASLVLVTRVDQAEEEQVAAICRRVASLRKDCPIVRVAFPPRSLVNASGGIASLESLRGTSVAAFCGIGNPQAFVQSVTAVGCEVAAFRSFPDHHPYNREDLEELGRWAEESAAPCVLTTQKDLVKIGLDALGTRPLWAVEIGAAIVSGADLLEAKFEEALKQVERSSPIEGD